MASFAALTTAVRNAGSSGLPKQSGSKQSGSKLNAFGSGTGSGLGKLPVAAKLPKEPAPMLHNPALPGFPAMPKNEPTGAQPVAQAPGQYAPVGVTSVLQPPAGTTPSPNPGPIAPSGGPTGTQAPPYDATYYQNIGAYDATKNLDIGAQTKAGGSDDIALQAALFNLAHNLKMNLATSEGNANASGGLYSSGAGIAAGNIAQANQSQVATDQLNNSNQHDAIANRIAGDNQDMINYGNSQGLLSTARLLALNANDPSIGLSPTTTPGTAAPGSGGDAGSGGVTATEGAAKGLTKGKLGGIKAVPRTNPVAGTTATKGAAKGLTKGYAGVVKGIAKSKKGSK